MKNKYKLVLASASPRRKEFIDLLKIPYEVIPSTFDEESLTFEDPRLMVQTLAIKKGEEVFSRLKEKNPLVIAADTIVTFENKILGKPKTIDEAKEMLLKLSGKEHQVLTGVSLETCDFKKTFITTSKVIFNPIFPEQLDHYISTGESMDKAGAYGIQGGAIVFVKSITGSYSNIVGLPIDEVYAELRSLLGVPSDNSLDWKQYFV